MPQDTLKPVSEKNLAGYDLPPLKWERAIERLEGGASESFDRLDELLTELA